MKLPSGTNVRERAQGLLTPVNLHWAGVGLLALFNLYLLVQMGLAWQLATSQNAEALSAQRARLATAQIAAKPLEGLDVKLATANGQADKFYLERLPMNYSEIATEMGRLKNSSKVRLTRLNYTQPANSGSSASDKAVALPVPSLGKDRLTEVVMDASLTGDYRALVTFINALERDKVFFLVEGITLTGQQTGTVSLRIRVTTFLRGMVPGEELDRANAANSVSGELENEVDAAQKRGVAR